MSATDQVAKFDAMPGAWMMQFDDGCWAYLDDEPPLGPFPSQEDAAIAAAQAGWLK